MRVGFGHRAVLGILLVCQLSVCFGNDTPNPDDSSKYLNAVRTFADNVVARSTRCLRLPAKRHSRR